MEKKDMNKVVIAIVAVTLIIAIIGGSTFAYWQWITASEQETLVNVTVQDGISMTIIPTTGTQTKPLYPVTRTNCQKASIEGFADVTVVNETGIEARPQFYLKLKIEKDGENITSTYAKYIKYAVSEYYTLDSNGNETTTESDYTCVTAPRYGTFAETPKQTKDQGNNPVEGWFDSPLITDIKSVDGKEDDETWSTRFPILPSEGTDNTDSITFKVNENSTGTHRFKFWAWIDSSYEATTTGTTVTDPLQDAQITLSWSDASIVKQVTE